MIKEAGPHAERTCARLQDGRLAGVAVWIPPGGYPFPIKDQTKQLLGALRALARRPTALWEGIRYLRAIEEAHPKDELWYLLLLAVDPAIQRSGIGARLQADTLTLADRQGLDCYLETQKEENLVYYRRFGYEVDRELRPVSNGPPLWTMRRKCRQPS